MWFLERYFRQEQQMLFQNGMEDFVGVKMAEIGEVCLKILEQNIDEVDTLLERKYGRRSRGMDHFEKIV